MLVLHPKAVRSCQQMALEERPSPWHLGCCCPLLQTSMQPRSESLQTPHVTLPALGCPCVPPGKGMSNEMNLQTSKMEREQILLVKPSAICVVLLSSLDSGGRAHFQIVVSKGHTLSGGTKVSAHLLTY